MKMLKSVQDIELGQADPRNRVDLNSGLPYGCVEPGRGEDVRGCTEFVTALSDLRPASSKLCWERT